MLVIREPQFKAFEEAARNSFGQRMLGHLGKSFGKQMDFLGPAQTLRVVALGVDRAARHGYESEREIYLYLTLMLMLGSWFDEDPQLPWAAAALADASILHPPARLDRLHDTVMAYLDQVAGESNEHLIRALVRIRDFDPASAESIPQERFVDEMAATLARFYPQKAAHQGEPATRAAVQSAAAGAVRYGFSGPRAWSLFAGLAFMLGSGFHRDPQFPWAQEALGGAGRPGDLDLLHRRALQYLEHGLT